MSLGVVIGRFQVPSLHDGHRGLIGEVLKRHDRVLVLIGNRPTPLNGTNPLPYAAVEMVVKSAYGLRVSCIPIMDNRSNDAWSAQVDAIIGMAASGQQAAIYSGRDGCTPHYKGKYPIEILDLDCPEVCATNIREEIGSMIEDDAMWRMGWIAAMQNLPHRTYHTVDIACVKRVTNKSSELLLAKKANERAWRFPGGFVEPHETFAQAAGREFHEETGLDTVDGFKIIGDFIIDDWRTQRQKGVSNKTVFCVGWYSHGKAVAQDDIAEVRWIDLHTVFNSQSMIMPEHHGLVHELEFYLGNLN